jgi:uncharacterized damage-inducible protein DinB
MKQINWFNREFRFDSTANIFPDILERLWGTPIRLEEKMRLISSELLTIRVDNSWTIKENIGHLTDLEPLWQGRLEDILEGQTELRPTDLQNTKTTEAHHNSATVEELLAAFRKTRADTLRLLKGISEEQVFMSALHPRLKTPMRTMNLFLFVAEHDDHHLARITELAGLS